ncbi:hypothetical protein [Deinococcus aquaedulcis]|nr:hypothetical protein [Deinococcus aquaedulcis]
MTTMKRFVAAVLAIGVLGLAGVTAYQQTAEPTLSPTTTGHPD